MVAVCIFIAFPLSRFILIVKNSEAIPKEHAIFGFYYDGTLWNSTSYMYSCCYNYVFRGLSVLAASIYNKIIEDIAKERMSLTVVAESNDPV